MLTRSLPSSEDGNALALRPYQRAAVEAFHAATEHGLRRVLVHMATGLGKTVLFSHLAHETVARGGRVLVIAHRDELLTQAREKLLMADPTAYVGIVRAELNEVTARIIVASIQTIVRPSRLKLLGRFDLVIVDEAHHAAAESYRQVLEALGAFDDDGPLVLGVTATPGRGDGIGLDDVFQEIVYSMGILDGITQGYLCDLRAVRVALETDFSEVHSRGGDLADGELGDALLAADAPEHVTSAYLNHADGRRAILFTPTVAVARAMAATMQEAGIKAAWLSGESPRDERRATLDALRSGGLNVVANALLLTEGFDCPPVDCIITARPTKSTALYTQMVGRGTRPYPGKQDCLVLDVIGQAGRLLREITRSDKPRGKLGKQDRELLDRGRRLLVRLPTTMTLRGTAGSGLGQAHHRTKARARLAQAGHDLLHDEDTRWAIGYSYLLANALGGISTRALFKLLGRAEWETLEEVKKQANSVHLRDCLASVE